MPRRSLNTIGDGQHGLAKCERAHSLCFCTYALDHTSFGTPIKAAREAPAGEVAQLTQWTRDKEQPADREQPEQRPQRSRHVVGGHHHRSPGQPVDIGAGWQTEHQPRQPRRSDEQRDGEGRGM